MTNRRRFLARLLAAAAALVVVASVAIVASRAHAHSRAGAGARPPAGAPSPGHTKYLGPTDPARPMSFQAVLRLPHQRALDRFLAAAYDPGSPGYRHYLRPSEFGSRFGLPLAEVARLRRRLEGAGLHVVRAYAERTTLDLAGTAGTLRRVFGVRMGNFRAASGRRFVAPLNRPVIPVSMRADIQGVAGLNTGLYPFTQDVPSGGLTSVEASKAYDITPLHDRGLEGQGQTIAIVSFGSFRQSDVELFEKHQNLDAPNPVRHVPVDGGTNDATGPNSGEVNLDIDVVEDVAPKAQILNYEAPQSTIASFTKGVVDIIHKIVADAPKTGVQIATMSYGLCDEPTLADGTPWLSDADRLAAAREFKLAAAAGISVFISSGDSGAFACQHNLLNDTRVVANWPADDPNVIAVGGTLLSVRADGTYLSETGWEDILDQSGTGGELNPKDPLPSYQQGVVQSDNPGKGGGAPRRQVPDVAAAADPDSGFFSVGPDPRTGDAVAGVIGGTSAATPFWAGSMLLIQQLAKQQGVNRLGFVDPMLYQLASTQQQFQPFHDVTLGGDRFHTCQSGWDFATGLGSPDVANLAQDVVAFLKGHPAA